MSRRKSKPDELELSRDTRVARQQLDKAETYLHYLEHAKRAVTEGNLPPEPELQALLERAEIERQRLVGLAQGAVYPRGRPTAPSNPTNLCTVYIDECGDHNLNSPDTFHAFALAAVIVHDSDFARVEQQWKTFKRTNLGSTQYLIHELDIRRQARGFNDSVTRPAILAAMETAIEILPFTAISIVVHRPEYKAMYGQGAANPSLPAHTYLMSLDFLVERLVLTLETQYGGARARIVCESRENYENATLQYELARLQVHGTTYISAAWFRQAFEPGITFYTKGENIAGLELVDLLARPCAEKVLRPESSPPRWAQFRQKLCPQVETKHSILGLKIMPWDAKYEDIWKS